MENFDRENIYELLKIRQIRQYFPPSKFCTVRYHIYRGFVTIVSAKKGYFVTIIIHRDHIQVGMCKSMAYTVVGHMPI